MNLLDDTAVSWAVVITMADKQKVENPLKLQGDAEEIGKHVAAYPDLFVTSSRNGDRNIGHI